jgi:1A family penicillin-binding protein
MFAAFFKAEMTKSTSETKVPRRIKNRPRPTTILLAAGITLCALLLIGFAALWFTLPPVDRLHERAQSVSTKINDRYGHVLYEIIDPRVGHHTPLPLSQIPVHLREATIAVEDANFYSNPGVDIVGIVRAVWINVQGGEVLAGGSTITQQLARMLLLDPEERAQRSLLRKVRESLLAWQIAQRYGKDEVLALYLNEVYYGNLAYGVEAAAQAYFGKTVGQLDLAECALLAGLPQSPVAYDPFNDAEAAQRRQTTVLDLMLKQGLISAEEASVAKQARLSYAPQRFAIRAPHFVSYVRRWLEEQFGAERVIRGGLIVTTTLDLALNDAAEDIIRARLEQLQKPTDNSPAHNTNNAALVALNPHTGEIVAMVGSPDFFDVRISGAVNAATSLRQPGSAIKPITYAAAFSSLPGFTAATPIVDVRTSFPTREGLPYVPENYNQQHVGPISVREALATSNNIAAVSVLSRVGLARMLDTANALGIHSFKSEDAYGLALTLGGGEVRLLELTTAYAAFANAGMRVDPYAVARVADSTGQALYTRPHIAAQKPAVDPRVAWLLTDVLADNAARSAAFGLNSVLRLSHVAAVKTGTTTDWRDNWTVGYTTDLVTGVWAGNANNEPMVRISGVTGAGPIWHDFMETALRGQPAKAFVQPDGLVQMEVCALSGLLPSPACPHTRREWFIKGTEPKQVDTWYRRQAIDVTTGKPARADTPPAQVAERVVLDLPAEARDWARQQGWPVYEPENNTANGANCAAGQACAPVLILQPDPGSIYRITRQLPRTVQRIPLQVNVADARIEQVQLILDGSTILATFQPPSYNGFWLLQPGEHHFVARARFRDGTLYETPPVIVRIAE